MILVVTVTALGDKPKYKKYKVIKILDDLGYWLAVITFLSFYMNTARFCFLETVGYVTVGEDSPEFQESHYLSSKKNKGMRPQALVSVRYVALMIYDLGSAPARNSRKSRLHKAMSPT